MRWLSKAPNRYEHIRNVPEQVTDENAAQHPKSKPGARGTHQTKIEIGLDRNFLVTSLVSHFLESEVLLAAKVALPAQRPSR